MSKERQKTCQGKHRHKSPGAAEAQIRSMVSRLGEHQKDLRAYLCRFCRGWHVGHVQARRRPKTYKPGRGGKESKGE